MLSDREIVERLEMIRAELEDLRSSNADGSNDDEIRTLEGQRDWLATHGQNPNRDDADPLLEHDYPEDYDGETGDCELDQLEQEIIWLTQKLRHLPDAKLHLRELGQWIMRQILCDEVDSRQPSIYEILTPLRRLLHNEDDNSQRRQE